ncbi:MAG: sulfite exporter TauE/SafE family protein, partial [Flavitalea sp.]
NGLLPCGLVYIGIAGAMSTGDILKGTLFMAFFGLGTVPVMLLLPYAGSFITLGIRNNIRKAVRPLIAVTALLLILRGLNLGIPYVSPKINDGANVASCHEQTNTKNDIKCIGPNSLHKK